MRGKQHIVKVARTKLERARRARLVGFQLNQRLRLGAVWTRRATTARLGRTRERTPSSLCPAEVNNFNGSRSTSPSVPVVTIRDDNPGGIGTSQPLVVTLDDSDDTVEWDRDEGNTEAI